MSNGHVCCLLGVCCPPPGNAEKQAIALSHLMSEEEMSRHTYLDCARWVVEHFDLVPKGVGAVIVEAYRPEFAKLHAHKEKPDAD